MIIILIFIILIIYISYFLNKNNIETFQPIFKFPIKGLSSEPNWKRPYNYCPPYYGNPYWGPSYWRGGQLIKLKNKKNL